MGSAKKLCAAFLENVLFSLELKEHPHIARDFEDIIDGKIFIAITGEYPSSIRRLRCRYSLPNLGMRDADLCAYDALSYLTIDEFVTFQTIKDIVCLTMELWMEQDRKIATMFELLNTLTSIIFDNANVTPEMREKIMHCSPRLDYDEFYRLERGSKGHVRDQIMLLTHHTHKIKTHKDDKWNR